jgi:single-stranded-DNA-specific exonuclease
VDVIVTDHHVPAQQLPPALAVVNPHRLPPGHALGALPGVGVAYELIKALNPIVADRALDLVALGTVADLAQLTDDTRYLVQRGLEALRHTDRPGLQAVFQAAGLRPDGISEEHIGFVLAPRLNALGRLADAAHGVELLTTDDWTRAQTLAAEMEGLNAQRKWLTKQVTEAALGQIKREPALLRDYNVLLLSHPTWPAGVIGIVAGRLAERYGKPTVLVAAPPDKPARGSGRSVPGVDLVAALSDCTPLLESFGGHKAAAGLSIQPDRIAELRPALSRAVAAQAGTATEPTLEIAAYVTLADLSLDLVAEINRLAPFGPGNPPLTLVVRDVHIHSEATIGRTEEHRRLTVQDAQDRTQTVFWWQGTGWPLPKELFDLALTLRASDYRGMTEVQVEWVDAREHQPTPAAMSIPSTTDTRDYRAVSNPETMLRAVAAKGDIQVWAESESPAGIEVRRRHELDEGSRLAIWTLPPDPCLLRAVLERVDPEEVVLFAHDPGMDEPPAFLKRLAGVAKFAIQARRGRLDLELAAAATSQSVRTVRAGLEWLASRGQVTIVKQQSDYWQLVAGDGGADQPASETAYARLSGLLAETAAYRAYAQSAPPSALLSGRLPKADLHRP